jgi:mRNA interferase MazF
MAGDDGRRNPTRSSKLWPSSFSGSSAGSSLVRRGELWWAELGQPHGSEPGLRRPVLVLQTDSFNESAIHTVVILPLTSNLRLASAPGNVRCGKRDTGLPKASVINVSQIAAVDRRRLRERIGQLPGDLVGRAEEGVRLVLGL